MDAECGQISHALSLLQHGLRRGVPGLEALLGDLLDLETIVYEVGSDLALAEYEAMSLEARLSLLLHDATADTIAGHMAGRARFFLQRRDPDKKLGLLRGWMVTRAAQDLEPIAQVIRLSAPSPLLLPYMDV
jgi:hypothetical protein